MRILVTGGTGYIGSHTCVELIEAGHDVVVVDNLCNSSAEAIGRIREITGYQAPLHRIDVRDRAALCKVFADTPIDAVMHFAALKAVAESVEQPLRYYDNNVCGTLALLDVMHRMGVRTLVFSSSATVYGVPDAVPIDEAAPLRAINPYGRSKLVIEEMLHDLQATWSELRAASLRYFNPAGAHPSGRIGESPHDIPNNLMPFVAQVAVGRLDRVRVFGADYPTPDGTGVRDYIHVVDLARGHVAALETLANPAGPNAASGVMTLNLGTGRGYSVLEVIAAFESASGCSVPYEVVGRRAGDVAECFADPALAQRLLGWRAHSGLDRICEDAWRWQQANPGGLSLGHGVRAPKR